MTKPAPPKAGLGPLEGAARGASAEVPGRVGSASSSTSAGRTRSRLGTLVPPIIVGVVLIAAWQLIVSAKIANPLFVPSPLDVVKTLGSRWSFIEPNIWPTVWVTLLGAAISALVGTALGVLLASWRLFRVSVYPYLVALQIVPKVALAPLFVIWFGTGAMPKLLMVFLIAFFPCVINTSLGIVSVDPGLLQMSRAFGGKPLTVFWKVKLPAALPAILSGIRIAVTLAVIGVVVAEFVAAQSGLGYVIIFAQGNLDTALAFASLLLLSAFGLLLYGLVALVEHRAVYWRRADK